MLQNGYFVNFSGGHLSLQGAIAGDSGPGKAGPIKRVVIYRRVM